MEQDTESGAYASIEAEQEDLYCIATAFGNYEGQAVLSMYSVE